MSRVVHFEISADEPQRALDFYTKVFDWQTQKWDGPHDYWLLHTGEGAGINGGLMKRQPEFPGIVNTIEVSSVDEFSEKVTANGGKIVVPKMPIPGVGQLAYCADTEGNIFGIMEADPAAQPGGDCGGGNS
jgi:uncharacterized protein